MDYYDILGVAKGASPDEIKRAFRKKAVEHHPDKGGDESKFKEISEAYDTLSDEDKRILDQLVNDGDNNKDNYSSLRNLKANQFQTIK
jgi:curved DNA-binding protein CbpA